MFESQMDWLKGTILKQETLSSGEIIHFQTVQETIYGRTRRTGIRKLFPTVLMKPSFRPV